MASQMQVVDRLKATSSSPGKRQDRWWIVLLIACGAVALYVPFGLPPFTVKQFTVVLAFAVATMGLNLLTGYMGQISLGHGAFFAVGAYTVAIFNHDTEVHVVFAVALAIVLTFVLGFLFGIPALRLHGIYLALVTIGIALVTPPLIKKFPNLTGGSQGIVLTNHRPSPKWGLAVDQLQYLGVLLAALTAVLIVYVVTHGRSGRALTAIRDNELVAAAMGVNLALVKTTVFAVSACLAGLGGALYALVIGYVSPESFGILLSISLLAAMVVGGVGTLLGPFLGAAFIQFAPVLAADVSTSLGGVLYGCALIIVMLVMPGGAMQLLRLTINRLPRRNKTNPDAS